MLVAVPVASMKTSFSGSNRCCSSLFQSRRAPATSARLLRGVHGFFKTDAVPIEKSPDRTHRHRNPTLAPLRAPTNHLLPRRSRGSANRSNTPRHAVRQQHLWAYSRLNRHILEEPQPKISTLANRKML